MGYERALEKLTTSLKKKGEELSRVVEQCQEVGSIFKRTLDKWKQNPYMLTLPLTAPISGRAASECCGTFSKFQKLIEVLEQYKYETDWGLEKTGVVI